MTATPPSEYDLDVFAGYSFDCSGLPVMSEKFYQVVAHTLVKYECLFDSITNRVHLQLQLNLLANEITLYYPNFRKDVTFEWLYMATEKGKILKTCSFLFQSK